MLRHTANIWHYQQRARSQVKSSSEWFQFFVDSIQKPRSDILLMESHSSHLMICSVDKGQPDVPGHLFTPAKSCSLLTSECSLIKSLNSYMQVHPNDKPYRINSHSLFNPAHLAGFQTDSKTSCLTTPYCATYSREKGIICHTTQFFQGQ